MHIFRRFSTLLLGAVFFVAGVLKLMDPVGASLLVEEYFKFLHLRFLLFSAGFFGVAIPLLEASLGAALMTGAFQRIARLASAVVLAFFTVLTFVMWLVNPAMDCGCFGEMIHLTHLQSFLKNLGLCLLWVLCFVPAGKEMRYERKMKKVSFPLAVLSVCALSLHSLLTLPLVEYTPYKVGTELSRGTDDEIGEYWEKMIYSKDGAEGSFDPDRLPDSTWTFVRTETYVRNLPQGVDGMEPFCFYDADGNYSDSLALKSRVMVLSVFNPENVSPSRWERMSEFIDSLSTLGIRTLVVTASDPESLAELTDREEILSNAFFADRRTLLAFNRSNGGATFIEDGLIARKWPWRYYPSSGELQSFMQGNPVSEMLKETAKAKMRLQGFLLYCFAVMLFL